VNGRDLCSARALPLEARRLDEAPREVARGVLEDRPGIRKTVRLFRAPLGREPVHPPPDLVRAPLGKENVDRRRDRPGRKTGRPVPETQVFLEKDAPAPVRKDERGREEDIFQLSLGRARVHHERPADGPGNPDGELDPREPFLRHPVGELLILDARSDAKRSARRERLDPVEPGQRYDDAPDPSVPDEEVRAVSHDKNGKAGLARLPREDRQVLFARGDGQDVGRAADLKVVRFRHISPNSNSPRKPLAAIRDGVRHGRPPASIPQGRKARQYPPRRQTSPAPS
jgi:hypothetical protein